ncbi:tom6p [Saccharomyces arboricola H-6]|uniref:Tom6p n=1 Tax=Saccharomyces arboricola (strain H-6 / AS 2.3317 / CBS 10644) TaxID=1160507 RepID=J8Q2B8_SACAR|nr:tom6p [Saccharomyces arboricola H-6]
MNGMFAMPGAGAGAAVPQQPKSRFQAFKESPLYTIALNGTFFIAGVAFIQSPLMDMLAPQL